MLNNLLLLSFLISAFSFEGDRVLDPFAGTASTGRIASELNRSAVLFEDNPSMYFKVGADGTVLYKHIAPLTMEIWEAEFVPRIAAARAKSG